MVPVLEAVPNFSEGRDSDVVDAVVRAVEGEGVDVVDHSSDPDHHRSVVTFLGEPSRIEAAAVAAARIAVERIDLRAHAGAHPRIGALDVLPFVPLRGLTLEAAADSARRVARRLVDELDLPVYFYGAVSEPPGRGLAEIRRGGFEAFRDGIPPGRAPDLLPEGRGRRTLHPTAGAVCVGARPLLLAWNVYVEGLTLEEVRGVAALLREADGGFTGLRTLGLRLPSADRIQISMNLEDLEAVPPFGVFRSLEDEVEQRGGRVTGTEIIGLIPDALVLPAAADRLRLVAADPRRLLSRRIAEHLASRAEREAVALVERVREAGAEVPSAVLEAAERLEESLTGTPSSGWIP